MCGRLLLLVPGSRHQALVWKRHAWDQWHVAHGSCQQGPTCDEEGKGKQGRFDSETGAVED